MQIYEELVARGLIAQVTNESEIRELINSGKAKFYIGFDCTADSLTAGHFMALTLMKRLQMAGNTPIALIGGGTTMIGDPSGRTDMRKMLTREDIQHNADCFRKQMERFIEFGEGKAQMVNNADWLLDLNYVELLREVGTCFSVNNMLRAECYKQRMEKGLSFFEFNYMIMQSYDFYYLFKNYDCNMQFGGDDQWSNMLGGTELIRKKLGKDAHAMTITLLTFIPVEEIDKMDSWEGSRLNTAKEILAYELTKLVHGEEEAEKAQAAARALFSGAGDLDNMPSTKLTDDDFTDGAIDILAVLIKAGITKSRGEGRRLVEQGGVSADDVKVTDIATSFTKADLAEKPVVIKKGKKIFHKIEA